MHSWLMFVLDSCRADTLWSAIRGREIGMPPSWLHRGADETRDVIDAREWSERHSAATWTGPAHYHLLSGLPPMDVSSRGLDTPGSYRRALLDHVRWLGLPPEHADTFVPELWLPSWLARAGYCTMASVSLPVLGRRTRIATGWHHYAMAEGHDNVDEHVREIESIRARPLFAMINIGETHYPYTHKGAHPAHVLGLPVPAEDDPADDPILHGLNGVAKRLSQGVGERLPLEFMDPERMRRYHFRQKLAARVVLDRIEAVVRSFPPGTRVTITADHGEAFGEGGWWGHGPVAHPVVHAVPYIDGVVR